MQHAREVLINGCPKANRRATPRVSVSRGRWHRPAVSPGSRGWAAVSGLHDQASARGEVKDTPPRYPASQDPMMNMGSRGIIAAVLDNDSNSDTKASKGRNRLETLVSTCLLRSKVVISTKLTSLCISQSPYRRLLRSSTSHGPEPPLQQVGRSDRMGSDAHHSPHEQTISAPWHGRALSAVTHWLTSRWRCKASTMILLQVHLQQPCYNFCFL